MIPFLLIAGGGYLLFDALGNSRKSFDPLDYGFPTKGYRGYRKGAAHFSDGGMTAGRWYRDKTGEEFKYIGKMDNGPDKGKLMFSDGKKHVYKTLEDFEGARPKESKLFGWFADGGGVTSEKQVIIDKLLDYEGEDFFVTDNLIGYIREIKIKDGDYTKETIIKKLLEYEGNDFFVTDNLIAFIHQIPTQKMADGGTTSKPIKVLKKFTDGDEYLTYRIVDEARKIIEVDDFTKAILIDDGILTEEDFKKVMNYFAFSYKNMSPEKLEKVEDLFEDNLR